MIAHISLPGGKNFEVARVASRAQAEEWFAWWLRFYGESQETLQAVRDGGVWTEKEAAKVRWRDGSRVVHGEVENYKDAISRMEDARRRAYE